MKIRICKMDDVISGSGEEISGLRTILKMTGSMNIPNKLPSRKLLLRSPSAEGFKKHEKHSVSKRSKRKLLAML